MIGKLKGIVDSIDGNILLIDVQGVSYEVLCSRSCLEQAIPGKPVEVITALDVKQDSLNLFGFRDVLERKVFSLLLQVKGVGAKSASDILSRIEKESLLRIVSSGDVAQLQGLKGIGKKTAERIVLELRDRVMEFVEGVPGSGLRQSVERISPVDEASQALQALGFSSQSAQDAIAKVASGHQGKLPGDVGEIVREALQFV